MRRETNIIALALFLASAAMMFAATGRYLSVYLAGGAAISLFAALRLRTLLQATGMGLALFFSATSEPTLSLLGLAVSAAGIFIYGGAIFGRDPWMARAKGFEDVRTEGRWIRASPEFIIAGTSALLLSVMASVLSSAIVVRADSLIFFIFALTVCLLILALASAFITER